MNFNFIPYKLNSDITDLKDKIQYLSSDNGIDLYRASDEFQKTLLGIFLSEVNLYFFEGNLITVYIHLANNPESLKEIREILEDTIKRQAIALITDLGIIVGWINEMEFLGLVSIRNPKKLYLYYSLRKYSVFEAEFS